MKKWKGLALLTMALLVDPLAANADPLDWFIEASLASGGSVVGPLYITRTFFRTEHTQTLVFLPVAAWWETQASLSSKWVARRDLLPQMVCFSH